jgi:anti-sigma factor RsiW
LRPFEKEEKPAVSHESVPLDCQPPDPLEERLVAYLDGELDDAEAQEIEQLLATDAKAREMLAGLERSWILLDRLGGTSVDPAFTRTTIEMVAMAATDDVAKQQAEIPRRRRRRRLLGAASLVAAGLAGFVGLALAWPNPNRELIDDLPVLENLDEFQRVFNKDDQDIRILQLLRENHLFEKDSADDS